MAIATLFVLTAAACGDSDEPAVGDGDGDGDGGGGGGGLVIGHIGPETGPLAFLGPPQFEGVKLAIEDINAAGGVLGGDVTLLTGDEAGDEAKARESAQRLLGEGANAIIGAASSGMSQAFIQLLFDNQIVQCSPSNTSPVFSDQENAAFYYRTVPPDEAVAPIIADRVAEDGHTSVAIVARADDYGNALADLVESNATELGLTVTSKTVYDPAAATFDGEIAEITGGDPDAVVVISFDEGAALIKGLIEAGITGEQLYGADGVFFPGFAELVDPNDATVIDGMTMIGASGGQEFNERLAPLTDGNLIYGGQAYDCAVIIALAAQAAGSTDSAVFAEEMRNVTQGGEECDSFAACLELLEAGEDIDYTGASGPLDLDENGDPTQATYAIASFVDGVLTPQDSKVIDLAEVG